MLAERKERKKKNGWAVKQNELNERTNSSAVNSVAESSADCQLDSARRKLRRAWVGLTYLAESGRLS
jgi:hypothetical protein